jgi:hypothetical protein
MAPTEKKIHGRRRRRPWQASKAINALRAFFKVLMTFDIETIMRCKSYE